MSDGTDASSDSEPASKPSAAPSTSRASPSSRSPAGVSSTRRRRPFEQLQAELGLELADALRQRWRRHVQAGRGAPEVALLGDGHEVPQAAQVDAVRHRRQRYRTRHDPCPSSVVDGRSRDAAIMSSMKMMWFHLMPYPDLPEDFNKQHRSVWVDIDPALFDADVMAETYEHLHRSIGLRRGVRLRRHLRQRAPQQRLRADAVAEPHRLDPRQPHVATRRSPCSATRWRSTTRRSGSPRSSR